MSGIDAQAGEIARVAGVSLDPLTRSPRHEPRRRDVSSAPDGQAPGHPVAVIRASPSLSP
jgi:hypothetical protein